MLIDETTRTLSKVALYASWAMAVIIPLQIIVFFVSFPHETAQLWLALFNQNWVLGLLQMDLLFIVDNVLLALLYLALYQILKEKNQPVMMIAILLGLLGIASFFSSNPAFEMWQTAREYAKMPRESLLTIAEALIFQWKGTAFTIYYVLNGITLITTTLVMRNSIFGNRTAMVGLISGILMIIPSTAGTVGLVCSLLSLIPWMIFLIMMTGTFRKLSRS
ncbi:MAG: hypothetical protein PHR69_08210 [Sphaerochaeta sp.]|nr:hypothetical protein [Sphaerochaeta sp.]